MATTAAPLGSGRIEHRELSRFLAELRLQLWWRDALVLVAGASLVGALLFALFSPWLLAFCAALAVVVALFRRPTIVRAARMADRQLRTADRLATASRGARWPARRPAGRGAIGGCLGHRQSTFGMARVSSQLAQSRTGLHRTRRRAHGGWLVGRRCVQSSGPHVRGGGSAQYRCCHRPLTTCRARPRVRKPRKPLCSILPISCAPLPPPATSATRSATATTTTQLPNSIHSLRQVAAGRYSATVVATTPGAYQVDVVEAKQPRKPACSEIGGFVVPPVAETVSFAANEQSLRRIASETGGELLDPQSDPFARNRSATGSRWDPFWQVFAVLALVAFMVDVAIRRLRPSTLRALFGRPKPSGGDGRAS